MYHFRSFLMYAHINHRITLHIEDYKYKDRMGCEQSIPVAKRKNSESLRKHRKKAEKVLGRNSAEIKLFENVHLKS